ncbi:bifunctional 2-polyprenyl-6-hydroxyphenol methylase/3-demethylubiquinol 3-O-methyltransferase UbiG [Kitasatospora sp. SUK 42]|uniref:class I SAM-dependent methyltransferase n=1 Tax=Kitasatospora sp. SUK 42 TaxID=1588882 RepID=UPI0018CAE769|nr:class I SAM-dependent methyltransferase [Kitasatospora sp. SUK 42]MBV2153398.1 class I SAM-dependent methyltransferase [Kitasatospora sp. SUK 42]
MTRDQAPYWNTNVARHAGILRAVPPGCGAALDVGCGDGLLASRLARRCGRVVGVDTSAEMVARARAAHLEPAFLEGDFLTLDLPVEGFDFVCSVSAIHHMDFEAALTRMRELLRPGGVLVVVGLAREGSAADRARRAAAAPLVRAVKTVRRATTPEGMPTTAPVMTYREVRQAAWRVLPGVGYRWHLLRRYSLTWRKP